MTTKATRSPFSAFSSNPPIRPLHFRIQLEISMTESGLPASFIRQKVSRKDLNHLRQVTNREYSGTQNLKCSIAVTGKESLGRFVVIFRSWQDRSYFPCILFFAG